LHYSLLGSLFIAGFPASTTVNDLAKVFVDKILWKTMSMNRIPLLGHMLILLAILGGCASKPTLEPRSGGNPAGVDLSGSWELRQNSGTPLGDVVPPEQSIIIPSTNARRQQQRRQRSKRSDGSAVHVFIESGNVLKITQTAYGLFVSFDRAVVEEFNFGENRTVSVGPIEAQRVSGWNGPVLIVETLDENGTQLTESWSLENAGAVLIRDISVTEDEETQFSTRQVFDRR
jgi:hypothetical protein